MVIVDVEYIFTVLLVIKIYLKFIRALKSSVLGGIRRSTVAGTATRMAMQLMPRTPASYLIYMRNTFRRHILLLFGDFSFRFVLFGIFPSIPGQYHGPQRKGKEKCRIRNAYARFANVLR